MKTYGLIGKALGHSFSKHYFEQKFNRENIEDSCYQNFELFNIHHFPEFIKKNTISGLNVTIPYKQSILPFLDTLSKEAFEIGAVNTIVVKEGKLIGHNTDHIGFHNALKPFLDSSMERALILGTGGASKAVKYALENIGIDCLLVSRSPDKQQISYTELNRSVLKHHLLVVNTSPLGTFPTVDECPFIPFEFLSDKHFVVDLIYNPTETLFLKKAKEQKATILNGKSMLIHQAEEAWKLWNS